MLKDQKTQVAKRWRKLCQKSTPDPFLLGFYHPDDMKKFASSLVAVALLGHLLSCSVNPAWILNPDASDWDRKSGLRLDTARNRAGLTSDYLSFIEREMAGEERDWGATWKGIFEALDRAEANPGFYKNWVIQERRKRGLPQLKF